MRFLRWSLVLVATISIFSVGFIAGEANNQRREATEEEVRLTLDRYVQARNQFDLDAFMGLFARSPELTVITGPSEYIGWDNLRRGITPLFESKSSTAEFSDIRVYPITRDIALVHHHYKLKSSRGMGTPSRSTKVFQRTSQGWKVIAEHSSRIPEFVRRERR